MSPKKIRKGVVKELVCAKCDTILDGNQLYCYQCGEPSFVLKKHLSAIEVIKDVWDKFKNNKGQHYEFVIFYFFLLLIPLAAIIIYTRDNYFIHNLILLLFLPLLFIPFSISLREENNALTIKGYLSNLKQYPKYLGFIFINILYLFLLMLVTNSVDPILNLVRLVMVLYWLAIVVPLPHLIANKNANPFKALSFAYKGGRETRWQQFFIYLFLTVINVVGLALLGIGLLITIPFSISVLEEYYLRMEEHNLFSEKEPEQTKD